MRRLLFALALPFALAALSPFDPWKQSARYEFSYRVDLSSIPARAGQRVRLWVPLPGDTPDQRLHATGIEAPFAHRETRDALGNRIAHLEWTGAAPQGAELRMQLDVTRQVATGVPAAQASPGSPLDPRRFLHADRLVPLDGTIGRLGAQHAAGRETPEAKVRALYDFVLHSMRYAKEGTGWGRGDAIWACNAKYGNCTDFHSLLIGMARSQGIAARFVIGFPIAPDTEAAEVAGYHCWAEFFDPARGWRPVDASEAWKSKRHAEYFGTLPSDRIEFSVGRDLVLEPRQAGEPLNFFIYPYAEVDGEPVAKVAAEFHFRRLAPESE